MAALPEELIEEILSRLPGKSLVRFKTVSKKWYSLISQNHKFHLKQSSSSSSASKNLILYQMDTSSGGAVFRYSDIDSFESRKFIFPVEICMKPYQLIGSANGLICLSPGARRGRRHCFIWNPCTAEYKSIALPFPVVTNFSSTRNGSGYTRLFGFGYDSISDDYKIIGDCDSRLRMFSLKTQLWKMLDFSVKCPSVVSPCFSNGALHWCFTATRFITAFDLAKEEIFFLGLPKEMKLWYWGCTWLPLFDYQGSLCISNGKSVWVMKEYCNPKSWAKFSTPFPEECSVPKGISRLGELVYRTSGGLGFVKSDIRGRITDEDKSQMLDSSDAFVYKESLISPKCFDPK